MANLLFVESESGLEEVEDLIGTHVRGGELPDDVTDWARRAILAAPFVGEARQWLDAPLSHNSVIKLVPYYVPVLKLEYRIQFLYCLFMPIRVKLDIRWSYRT